MSWLKNRHMSSETPKNSTQFNSGQQQPTPPQWNQTYTQQPQSTNQNWQQYPTNNSTNWNPVQNQYTSTQFEQQNNINNNSTNAPNTRNSSVYQNEVMTSQHFQTNDSWNDWNDWNENSTNIPQQPQYVMGVTDQHQQIEQPPNAICSPNQNSSYQLSAPINLNQNSFSQEPNVQLYNPNIGILPQPSIIQASQTHQQPPPPSSNISYPSQISGPQSAAGYNRRNVNDDSWNWNTEHQQANQKTIDSSGNEIFHKMGHSSAQKHIRNISNASSNMTAGSDLDNKSLNPSNEIQSINTNFEPIKNYKLENIENLHNRLPDDLKNTQQLLQNPNLTRVMRGEHQLTPQWSIESQVSQTSSDRSIESDNLDSRSSATNTSDEANLSYGTTNPENVQNIVPAGMYSDVSPITSHLLQQSELPVNKNQTDTDLDSLDQVLMEMNVIQPDQKSDLDFYQETKFVSQNQSDKFLPLPPPPLDSVNYQNRVTNSPQQLSTIQNQKPIVSTYVSQQDTTEYHGRIQTNILPPPSVSPGFSSNNTAVISGPPSTNITSGSGNPFKRTGIPVHRNMPFNTPNLMPTNFYQEVTNQESLTPDNSEVPIPMNNSSTIRNTEIENLEIAPTNERNQYLQTGHLSEDGYGISSDIISQPPPPQESNDNFPPPGLSRFVLGQPESDNNQQQYDNNAEPPPGLDRMIPGTELTSASNMERQADGQVSNFIAPQSQRNYNIMHQQHIHQQHADNSSTNNNLNLNTTDRNLYLVPGESDIQSQRVIPGLEHEHSNTNFAHSNNSINHNNNNNNNNNHNINNSNIVIQSQIIEHELPINEQQRELIMDGENLDDQQQQLNEIRRNEPIEGANDDELQQQQQQQSTSNHLNSQEKDLVDTIRRKEHSNPSTANDDSDKDRSTYYSNKSRRNDNDGLKKQRNKQKERYDTEDTDYYSDRDRDRKRYPREGSDGRDVRNERYKEGRDKERNKDRKDGNGRDRDRYRDNRDAGRDRDRYEKDRNRDRYDRRDRDRNSLRYETDGSKYDYDTSTKYDRDNKRRYEKDENGRRIEERDDKDKRYGRGERDRDPRRRDDRYKDEREKDRRRDRERGDRRYEMDDGYHRTGSRNTNDHEKDRRYPQNYYASGYGYDAYSYYSQHQQYYESLRRTNPQAYAEWYRKYYSQIQTQMQGAEIANTDGRESVHSGRSSANEKLPYNRPVQQQQQPQPQYYNPIDYHHRQFTQSHSSTLIDHNLSGLQQQQQHQHSTNYLMPSRSYYTQSEFSESRIDNLDSTNQLESTSINQSRLTPTKFTTDHCLGSLSSGLLTIVKPKYSSNSTTNTVKIINLTINDSTRKLLHAFPGPLIRGVTHKKTIIEFCEEQLRIGPFSACVKSRGNSINSVYSLGQPNRSSFVLMWNLLILLLRQNGMVVGTDISELLIKNQGEFPYEIQTTLSNKKSPQQQLSSRRNSIQSDSRRSHENQTPSEDNIDEINDDHRNERSSSSEERENININKQLTEEEITEKFRNYLLYGNVNEALDWATDNNLWGHALFLASKVDRRSHANVMMKFANKLALNDPLQTLFQLMSGRIPSAVTSVQDEKWGDWRSHLAMILSNTSQKPDLDRKAITTLGDSLYNRGDLFGAQFCYLMAQVGFGKYSNVNQESALMFNSANVIRLILLGSSHHKNFKEFATNEAIMMTEIYEYACALNDDKFSIIEFQPYKYLLATRMLDYGLHLKTLMYMEQITNHILKDSTKYSRDFIEKISILADRLKYHDPAFEKNLEDLNNTNDGGNEQQINLFGEQKWLQDLRTALSQINTDDYDNVNSNIESNDNSAYQQQQTTINEQFVEITKQFNDLNMQYTDNNTRYQKQTSQPGNDYIDPLQQAPPQFVDYKIPQNTIGDLYGQHNYERQDTVPADQLYSNTITNHMQETVDYNSGVQQNYGMQLTTLQTSMDHLQPSPSTNNDYWGQMPTNSEIQKPSISMPNSMSNKPGFHDESPTEQSKTTTKDNPKKVQPKDNKNLNSSGNANNAGWFGGIWNKLSLKPKNQMILPDDKNPAILWDSDKKKWVNKDHTEEQEEEFKPPPKITDINQSIGGINSGFNQNYNKTINPPIANEVPLNSRLPTTTTQQPGVPVTSDINKIPNLQSNMFKMQRNRTLKNSYVDVFNPSGASTKPAEGVPAPQLLPMVPPQSGYFVPNPNESQGQDGAPQFYNPNQYNSNGGFQ